jgi:hypothetical protein
VRRDADAFILGRPRDAEQSLGTFHCTTLGARPEAVI